MSKGFSQRANKTAIRFFFLFLFRDRTQKYRRFLRRAKYRARRVQEKISLDSDSKEYESLIFHLTDYIWVDTQSRTLSSLTAILICAASFCFLFTWFLGLESRLLQLDTNLYLSLTGSVSNEFWNGINTSEETARNLINVLTLLSWLSVALFGLIAFVVVAPKKWKLLDRLVQLKSEGFIKKRLYLYKLTVNWIAYSTATAIFLAAFISGFYTQKIFPDGYLRSLFEFFFLCLLISIVFVLILYQITFSSLHRVFEYFVIRSHTKGYLLYQLTNFILDFQLDDEPYEEVRNRKYYIYLLDCISLGFENFSNLGFYEKDIKNKIYIDSRFSEISSYFREMKIWVSLPMEDTFTYMEAQILLTIRCLVREDYHSIPRLKKSVSDSISGRETFINLAKNVASLIFRATLPFVFLYLIRLLFQDISEQVFNSLTIGAFIWSALVLIVELDPKLEEKLNFIGQIQRLLLGHNNDRS